MFAKSRASDFMPMAGPADGQWIVHLGVGYRRPDFPALFQRWGALKGVRGHVGEPDRGWERPQG